MSDQTHNFKYVLLAIVIFIIGFGLYAFFFAMRTAEVSLVSTPAAPTPTEAPGNPLHKVDQILNKSMSGSIAYNVPNSMKLNETVTIELLINPSVSANQLKNQIEDSGSVTAGTIQVSPLMKAVLIPFNANALSITSLSDTPEQPVNSKESTKWQWLVTAHEGGTQGMTLVVYRLIQYKGQDYWREVETYRADINVKVSIAQRLQAFDWKWLIGLLVTSVIVPSLWRWLDKRRQTGKSSK